MPGRARNFNDSFQSCALAILSLLALAVRYTGGAFGEKLKVTVPFIYTCDVRSCSNPIHPIMFSTRIYTVCSL
jgi:hypothetical protein